MNEAISLPLLLGLSRSTGPAENHSSQLSYENVKHLSFCQRLHFILSRLGEGEDGIEMKMWRVHGRAFEISNVERMTELMLGPNECDGGDSGDGIDEKEGRLEEQLIKHGFKRIKGGRDEGCFWKEGFTWASAEDATHTSCIVDKKEKADASSSNSNNNNSNTQDPKIQQFLQVTASTNHTLARRYLEMTSGNVELAVTYFLEGGFGGEGFGAAADADGGGNVGGVGDAGGEGNDDAEKSKAHNKEEPDFYSMPYVTGPKRPSPAAKIVHTALCQYWAFRTLRRALLRWIQSRQVNKMDIENVECKSSTIAVKNMHNGTSHFLFQSLIHPSLSIRRAAGRMFMHNMHQLHTTAICTLGNSNSGKSSSIGSVGITLSQQKAITSLQESLIILLQKVLFNESPYNCSTSSSCTTSISHQQPHQGDPAVQLVAMLNCLVTNGGFTNVIISDQKNISSEAINEQVMELERWSIESFVAGGGLRWVCGGILRLVHLLVHGTVEESASDGDGEHQRRRWKNGGVSNETIQSRLVLLIDLVYRLVLFGSVPAAVDGKMLKKDEGEEEKTDGKTKEDDKKKKRRQMLQEMMQRQQAAETSRTMALRSSIRSLRGVTSPPLASEKDKEEKTELTEENRLRRERRKATLERVHALFWKTTIPAAMCIGEVASTEYYGHYSPLACLVAAYEILRTSKFDDVTNKAIGILSRLVDPAAGCCLVVSDPEIPWGLAGILDWEGKDESKIEGSSGSSQERKKRDRVSLQPSSLESLHRYRASPSRPTDSAQEGHRAKRQRTRRSHISSLLERLTGDNNRESTNATTNASSYSPAAASASSHYSNLLMQYSAAAAAAQSSSRDGSLSRIIGEDRFEPRARAVVDRSPGDWRLIDPVVERDDEGEGDVVMMEEDEDNDTEFEQEQEEGGEDMDDLPEDEGDAEDGGDEDGEDEDGDEGDENGDESDEGEDSSIFDDAVILMDQVTTAGNDDREQHRNNPHRQPSAKGHSRVGTSSLTSKQEHEQAYLRASMEILTAQYLGDGKGSTGSATKKRTVTSRSIFSQPPAMFPSPLLTLASEQSLMQSMCDIVKPPKKPLNLKIFLRRAPTQEEFFRGALSRNPINLSSLKAETPGGDDSDEPTFADLRKHIAKDLQMEDSAELLELLVATKIVDINVKLRVCQQVLWKKYVMENSTSVSSMISGAGPGHQMINTGSGLSMIFSSSSLGGRVRGSTDDLDVTQLPPMVVTYRLAGVDGEATEDKVEVEDLEDPEAVVVACPKAFERKMEKEFGITRSLADHGGISTILASVQSFIDEVTTRIRRDEIRLKRREPTAIDDNATRVQFAKSAPCAGLLLLRHCANITDNRKKMLSARAPTMLLRLLLDVLNAMNRSPSQRQRSLTFDGQMDIDEEHRDNSRNESSPSESNPTTNALQEIIELLASDISVEVTEESSSTIPRSGSFVNVNQMEGNEDHGTLPLVLKSLRSANLSPPLRKIVSKLLPFLTYGQVDQSEELASCFIRYIKLELLAVSGPDHDLDMMNTFVDTAINLPPVAVCDNLRQSLISNGFVDQVRSFIMVQAPLQPSPWSPALYPKQPPKQKKANDEGLKEEWKQYFDRPGLVKAIKILIGLCSKHHATQIKLTEQQAEDKTTDLPTLCHWIESTSDNESAGIKTNGLGILAETLLDALKDGNDETSEKIAIIRKKTRDRKKEIAEERRNRALVGMSAFGTLAGSALGGAKSKSNTSSTADTTELRSTSMFASMFGLAAFTSSSQRKTRASAKEPEKSQPSWMAEMEAMEEESGVTCAVCQEGRTLQPSELLGLYAFMKKVTIPSSQGGDKGDIDGTVMLISLPVSCPRSLIGTVNESFFQRGKVAANALHGTSQALTSITSSSSSSRTSFITSVSAGNAIHCSCHARAKAADRSHPKAPKSEWEGASLRNSRVTCNVILPLVSSKTSNVPLIAVESALGEVNTITTTILGVRPKSMLWNVLHDIRLLLLRMAYGEALNADCGGGSSSSNFLLVLYQLYTADMLSTNAELDDPQVAKHARGLSPGFLAASSVVDSVDFSRQDTRSKRLERGLADASAMAALCSILFYNSTDDGATGATVAHDLTNTGLNSPSPNRQWELHKEKFLCGLLRCAGHRHSLGVTDSGCVTSRGISTGSRKNVERARSFMDWSADDGSGAVAKKKTKGRSILEDYAVPLRPMITLYAIFNSLSREFIVNDTDENTLSASERLASTLESCLKATSIIDLLNVAEITMDHDAICKYFEKGLLV